MRVSLSAGDLGYTVTLRQTGGLLWHLEVELPAPSPVSGTGAGLSFTNLQ